MSQTRGGEKGCCRIVDNYLSLFFSDALQSHLIEFWWVSQWNLQQCSEMSWLSLDLNRLACATRARNRTTTMKCLVFCFVLLLHCRDYVLFRISNQMDVREKCQGNFPMMTLSLLWLKPPNVRQQRFVWGFIHGHRGQRREENANWCFYLRLQIKTLLTRKGNWKYDGGCAGL